MANSVVKNTITIGIITFLSRILGYIRDSVLAYHFGTSYINEAFVAAFRFANLFRSVFAEGALTVAFTPVFAEMDAKYGKKHAKEVAQQVQAILIVMLGIFCFSIIAVMPWLIRLITPGFANNPKMLEFTTDLAQITFPYLFFISLSAFYAGILGIYGSFAPFAATSIILNIVMICASYIDSAAYQRAYYISYSVLLAGFLELLWMIYVGKRHGCGLKIVKPVVNSLITNLIKRIGIGTIGASITQINVWINMILLSFVPGGMSYLYYADRLVQLPMALIATSASTVLLPMLSIERQRGACSNLMHMQNNTIDFALFCLIPSAFVLYFFSDEIIKLLFERGLFLPDSTQNTAQAMRALALGLPAYGLIKIFSNIFYANQNNKTPVKLAGIAMLINLAIGVVTIQKFKHVGVASASSISAWANLIGLGGLSALYYGFYINKFIIKKCIIYILFSFLAVYIVSLVYGYFSCKLCIIVALALGGMFYLLCSYIVFKVLRLNLLNGAAGDP